jgi:hypothetical protein
MSNYDNFLKETPKAGPATKKKKKSSPDTTWNLLTLVMLLMTFCACFFIFSILQNPNSGLNPLAPPTMVPPPATATWTPIGYAATWTPTVTLPPTETFTPRPTYTIMPSATPFVLMTSTPFRTPTITTTPTRTARPTGVPYSITVTFNESTIFRADTSCSSTYIAGQALDAKNKPVVGLQVKLGGSVPGKTFVPGLTTLTGISPVYGQSGFEFDLQLAPVASSNTLWVQLYDQSGSPLSEQYKLTTYADCKKNLIFVRFQQK